MPNLNRREFITTTCVAATASVLPSRLSAHSQSKPPKLHVFSKHLQFLDYREMAKIARKIGFGGVDLTVRRGGHVAPENVQADLPQAVEAIRELGLEAKLMTTAVDDADDPIDRELLNVAAREGLEQYRMNWFSYPKTGSMQTALDSYRDRIQKLGALNAELNLVGSYQNHAGLLVGASPWEIWQILSATDPDHFGVQYDIRHATVEGGRSWENGFRLLKSRIKSLVIKDFRWELENGRARIVNTPLGEGMVDFSRYFKLLKENEIEVPFSIHFEYELGGAQSGKRELTRDRDTIYDAMRKDIATFERLWREA